MSATNLMFSYNNVTFWTRNTNCILSSANGYDTTGISVGIVIQLNVCKWFWVG